MLHTRRRRAVFEDRLRLRVALKRDLLPDGPGGHVNKLARDLGLTRAELLEAGGVAAAQDVVLAGLLAELRASVEAHRS
jgi:hypothetical protein